MAAANVITTCSIKCILDGEGNQFLSRKIYVLNINKYCFYPILLVALDISAKLRVGTTDPNWLINCNPGRPSLI